MSDSSPRRQIGALQRLLNLLRWAILMVLAIVDDLAEDGRLHIGQGNLFISATIIHHVPAVDIRMA